MFDDLLDLFERKSRRPRHTSDDREMDADRARDRDRDDDRGDDDRDDQRPRSRKRRLSDLLDFD